MLLRRRPLRVVDAVERQIALQAQVPRDPYIALWSRLDRFDAERLSTLIQERRAVRMSLHRGTIHLVTAEDAIVLRPVIAPVGKRLLHSGSPFGKELDGMDVDELTAFGRELIEQEPRTRAELTPFLAERWPDRDAASLSYAVSYLLPIVQVTPRGLWGRSGKAAFTTVEHWLGRSLATSTEPDDLVLRYLRVFGPAAPADLQSWSGLNAMREVLERLRPRLRTFRDEAGRELFDVPRGPLPDPDTPAPVRFLPEYDNVLLGHKDRKRIVSPETKMWTEVGWGCVLVDGFTAARWRMFPEKRIATIRIEPFRRFTRGEDRSVSDEAERLLRFLAPEAGERDVRIADAR
jgi:hypothetical protein